MSETIGNWTLDSINHVDLFALCDGLPDASVDLVIADPPYNVSKAGGRNGFKGKIFVSDLWDVFADDSAYATFSKRWMDACRRVLKDSGAIYVWGYHRSLAYMPIHEWYQLNLLVWRKINAFPTTMHDSMWSPSCEFAYYLRKGKGRDHTFHIGKNDFARDVFDVPIVNNPSHPCQKPLEIISEFIRRSTSEGDIVLDPFCGSGTTALAARNAKRHWLCGDTDAHYCDVARDRLRLPFEAKRVKASDDVSDLPLFAEVQP